MDKTNLKQSIKNGHIQDSLIRIASIEDVDERHRLAEITGDLLEKMLKELQRLRKAKEKIEENHRVNGSNIVIRMNDFLELIGE